jgi:transcriptional regulator with XRE-family HTH domain
MRKLSRLGLGPKFSEGARRLWLALRKRNWSQTEATQQLKLSVGMLSRFLYGDRKPGRQTSEILRIKLGIEPPLWDRAPAKPFSPPAATESAKAA